MLNEGFPLEKSDIQYDPETGEVTLKRGKFDAFIEFVRGLLKQVEAVEDARDIESYRARRAEATVGVLQALMRTVEEVRHSVQAWLASPHHTLQELSRRTGIPYATCYRIVRERLFTEKIAVDYLAKLAQVVGADQAGRSISGHVRFVPESVVVGAPKSSWRETMLKVLHSMGTEVATAEAGTDVAKKVQQLRPDLVLLDVSMAKLSTETVFNSLREQATGRKTIVLFTEDSKAEVSKILRTISTRHKSSLVGREK